MCVFASWASADNVCVPMFRLHRIARSTAFTASIDLLLACSLANATCAIMNIMTTLIFIIISWLHAFSLVVVVRSFLHVLMVVAVNYYFWQWCLEVKPKDVVRKCLVQNIAFLLAVRKIGPKVSNLYAIFPLCLSNIYPRFSRDSCVGDILHSLTCAQDNCVYFVFNDGSLRLFSNRWDSVVQMSVQDLWKSSGIYTTIGPFTSLLRR